MPMENGGQHPSVWNWAGIEDLFDWTHSFQAGLSDNITWSRSCTGDGGFLYCQSLTNCRRHVGCVAWIAWSKQTKQKLKTYHFLRRKKGYIFSFIVFYMYIHSCSQLQALCICTLICHGLLLFVWKLQDIGLKKCDQAFIGHID